ncbi:MAG: hypothetical protein LC102_10200 [Ignavibacteriales bacterium]|nr:MAG: hypothetical protein F9K26_11880 [Ignavibacteriaceae bacterium]MBW7873555.1 hypothetical protein [Ignavibacteria bacterium]MCZ2143786.1 hypothetical protein [Ignavibacteriales bacterium]OQY70032.1 MAG: hypothetical protein B6D45_11900 [Ignavibacteriales bacterium UTCHB3]MBV6445943.1 hypothetical protein [Ignavibacteriaceae bacterium]
MEKKKPRTKLFLLIGAVIIAVVLFFVLSPGDNSANQGDKKGSNTSVGDPGEQDELLDNEKFLSYLEFSELSRKIQDKDKVKELLEKKGYKLIAEKEEPEESIYAFEKIIGKDSTLIEVFNLRTSDVRSATETSRRFGRWKYYEKVAKDFGFKEKERKTDEKGNLSVLYANEHYELKLYKDINPRGRLYQISIRNLD